MGLLILKIINGLDLLIGFLYTKEKFVCYLIKSLIKNIFNQFFKLKTKFFLHFSISRLGFFKFLCSVPWFFSFKISLVCTNIFWFHSCQFCDNFLISSFFILNMLNVREELYTNYLCMRIIQNVTIFYNCIPHFYFFHYILKHN